jgi:hypothetical protein
MTQKNTSITFKWLVGVLVTITLTLMGLGVTHTVGAIDRVDKKVETVEREKVDKDNYREDQRRIEKALDNIGKKIDKLIEKL